jgi:hypothetical protein
VRPDAVLIVIVAAFVSDNSGDTRIGYVFGDVSAPVVAMLLGTGARTTTPA